MAKEGFERHQEVARSAAMTLLQLFAHVDFDATGNGCRMSRQLWRWPDSPQDDSAASIFLLFLP